MALDTPAAPSTLDKYELLKEQTEGGFGSTWIARADEGGDPPPLYSVLRVSQSLVKKAEAAELFVAEVRKTLDFRSPTLLATVDAGLSDGEIFVVNEYVEGESLAALLTAAGAEGLATPISLRILLDVISAVAAGHALEKPIVHGEIGPQHIRVGVDGIARIGGFGTARALAKLSVHGAKNHDRLSYAAPERVKGMASTTAPQVALDPRADVFSLGVLVWEAISRQRLFASRIEAAVIQKVLTAPIAALASLPGVVVPPHMDEPVQRALDRDPAKRSQSAADLLKALQGAGSGFIASRGEVAAKVEKLVGKAVAERRMELAAALGRKSQEPGGARASSSAIKAQSAPAVSAAAVKPASAPAAARPVPGPAAARPASEQSAVKPAALAPAVRSVPNRTATMLGGVGPRTPAPAPVVEAPKPVAPKVEAAAADPLQAANDDWNLSFSDEALEASKPVETPKPAAARPAPGLRSQTVRGGFDPKLIPAAAAPVEVSRGIDVPAAAAVTSAPGLRATTKPRAGQPVPIQESIAPSSEEPATKITAFTAEDFEVPIDEAPAPKAAPAPRVAPPAPKPAAPRAAPPAPKGTPAAAPRAAAPAPPAPKAAPAAVPVVEPASSTGNTPGSPGLARGRTASAIDQVGPGSTLGRYEILMPIARGGMASVWAARLQGSRGFQKLVAVKTMLPDVSDDPDFETMFLDEATVAARIRHPNVAEIMDLGEDHDVLYLVMEWIDGENLSTVIKGAKPMGGIPLPIVLRIASQACAGLHAAHELKDDAGNLVDLIHRDVSPANVLVSTTGFVKLVDFGVAKSKNRMHVTRAGGMVKGKTPYLSPEQLGQLALDRRSDIFSFGVLLYVLATGLHPFRGETEGKTIENIALREPVSLQAINAKIPIEFERVVFKALQKDREKRYATAAELQRALDQVAVSMGMPASDADVADFVRTIIGEASQKRAQEIKAAIASLDGAGSAADLGKAEARAPESKTPRGGIEAPKPEPLEEPLPTASTREISLISVPAEEEISFEAELPQVGDAVAAQVLLESAPPPPSAREADLPTAPFAPPPAITGVPVGGFAALAPPPPVRDERGLGAAIFDEETSASAAMVDGRARRSRTVGIIVGATIGGAALVGVLAMVLSKGSPSDPGAEATTTVAPLLPASAGAALPAPSATPSAASAPPPPTSAAAPQPPPTVAAPLDPPLFTGKFPPAGKAPAKPPGAKPPAPPLPSKPPAKPPKYNPTGI
jgi:serine/threonine protein kinase